MSRNPSRLTLFVLVGLLGVDSFSTSSKVAGAEPERKPIDLSLRFTPGRELLYFVTTNKVVTNEEDKKHPYQSKTQYLLRWKVQSVSKVEATLQLQFDQVRWLPSGVEEQGFDSANPPNPDEPPIFTSARSMIGKPFVATMNQRGEILSLRPVDVRAKDAGPDANSLQLVGETQLRSLLLSFYSWMPEQPVLPHESWTRHEEMNLGFMKLQRTNTVAVVGGTYSIPQIESQISIQELPSQGMIQGNQHIVGHLRTSVPGKGTIRFDAQQGILESIESSVAYEMTLETTDTQKKRAKPKVLTQHLHATTRVELRAVNGVPTPLAN